MGGNPERADVYERLQMCGLVGDNQERVDVYEHPYGHGSGRAIVRHWTKTADYNVCKESEAKAEEGQE